MEALGTFSCRSGARQGCSLSPLLFNIVLDVLAKVIRQEKEIQGILIRKEEIKPALFVYDIIICVEDWPDPLSSDSSHVYCRLEATVL